MKEDSSVHYFRGDFWECSGNYPPPSNQSPPPPFLSLCIKLFVIRRWEETKLELPLHPKVQCTRPPNPILLHVFAFIQWNVIFQLFCKAKLEIQGSMRHPIPIEGLFRSLFHRSISSSAHLKTPSFFYFDSNIKLFCKYIGGTSGKCLIPVPLKSPAETKN